MKVVITGGAGFIGSNLVDHFLENGHEVVVLDNLATGFEKNIEHHYSNPAFTFINGDIRDLATCRQAVAGCHGVLHQAALGSVPRSLKDPLTTNEVNISGFLNMLIATRDEGISRFVYAASSSTYGDSKELPKVEENIGKPLSPYAVTKYVNELYADVFARTWNMECIGLRYFNVFGQRQDPNGAYAAVIPLWVKALLNHQSPIINGDGSTSRDFTYIQNVIQANELALTTTAETILERKIKYEEDNKTIRQGDYETGRQTEHTKSLSRSLYKSPSPQVAMSPRLPIVPSLPRSSFHEVFNIAYGASTTLLQLFAALRDNLARYDAHIKNRKPEFRDFRTGDIPHSMASIEKAQRILDYKPLYDIKKGLNKACSWYYTTIKHE